MPSITNSTAVSSAVSQASNADQVSTLVLKKALDTQAQTAALLIQAVAQTPSTASLPPNLGRNVNTSA